MLSVSIITSLTCKVRLHKVFFFYIFQRMHFSLSVLRTSLVICKLAKKWYLMYMCISWLCPFKVSKEITNKGQSHSFSICLVYLPQIYRQAQCKSSCQMLKKLITLKSVENLSEGIDGVNWQLTNTRKFNWLLKFALGFSVNRPRTWLSLILYKTFC